MENAVELGGIIIGLTGLVARYVPSEMRDSILPLVSVALGVTIMVLQIAQTGAGFSAATLVPALWQGVILGGTSTGLFAATKGIVKK
jgi:hypothetical protein